jgi:hypothetical protein
VAAGAVELVGATELRVALDRLGKGAADPRIAEDAAELVAAEARDLAPYLHGALTDSIRVERALPAATVVAGSSSVPYAGVQEYGWPARGIQGRHYLEGAVHDQADDVTNLYADRVGALVVEVGATTR